MPGRNSGEAAGAGGTQEEKLTVMKLNDYSFGRGKPLTSAFPFWAFRPPKALVGGTQSIIRRSIEIDRESNSSPVHPHARSIESFSCSSNSGLLDAHFNPRLLFVLRVPTTDRIPLFFVPWVVFVAGIWRRRDRESGGLNWG
ncbi:hypothetical protein MLD38_007351 [Melastoma candidum]|uniref:Uncharacterized protein n=1 Tax=Melastoma candidum TaxID=119954 RepID=A0ACB9RUK6_9MYRT|nr:hypothetical protein MLD38_007351 [Melastoma candidum]